MVKVQIIVKLFSVIRIQIGSAELDLEMPEGSTIKDLLDYLEEKYEQQLDKIFRSKDGSYMFNTTINGKNSDVTAKLNDGDIVALLTPVCGG
jgi:MoaD family protein